MKKLLIVSISILLILIGVYINKTPNHKTNNNFITNYEPQKIQKEIKPTPVVVEEKKVENKIEYEYEQKPRRSYIDVDIPPITTNEDSYYEEECYYEPVEEVQTFEYEPVESVGSYYPLSGVVEEVVYEDDTSFVSFKCQNGNTYSFNGAEDWCEGDIVAAIMYDGGTPKVYDDEVVETRYVGYGWEY